MKTEIENYKGQLIVYNDDTDKFECELELSNNVRGAKRGSLKDLRKEIDQFIKTNLEFKPFKFIQKSTYSSSFEVMVCSAIRTDGQFIVSHEGSDRKSYFKNKDLEYAMDYDPDIVEDYNKLKKEFEAAKIKFNSSVADLFTSLTPCKNFKQYQNND